MWPAVTHSAVALPTVYFPSGIIHWGKMRIGITFVGIMVLTASAAVRKIPSLERQDPLLKLYDPTHDRLLSTRIAALDCEGITQTTKRYGGVKYSDFSLKSQLDYLDTFEATTSAKLNLMASIVNGNGDITAKVSKFLKREETSIVKVIKMDRKTQVESIDPCSIGTKSCLYHDIFNHSFTHATHVVVGEESSAVVEVFVKLENSDVDSTSNREAALSASVETIMGLIRGSAELQIQQEGLKSIERQELKILVESNIPLPLPLPSQLHHIPDFIQNVTRYISENPGLGNPTQLILAELSDVANCFLGSPQVYSSETATNTFVEDLKTVMQEFDKKLIENSKLKHKLETASLCLSDVDQHQLQLAIYYSRRRITRERDYLIDDLNEYLHSNSSSEAFRNKVDLAFSLVITPSFGKLEGASEESVKKLELYYMLTGFGARCLPKYQNPHFLPKSLLDQQIYYLTVPADSCSWPGKPHVLNEFVKLCSMQNTSCFVINCDLGFSDCSRVNSTNISMYGSGSLGSRIDAFDPLVQSIVFLYNRLFLVERQFFNVDKKIIAGYNRIRAELAHKGIVKNLTSLNATQMKTGIITGYNSSLESWSPIEKLVGGKIRVND